MLAGNFSILKALLILTKTRHVYVVETTASIDMIYLYVDIGVTAGVGSTPMVCFASSMALSSLLAYESRRLDHIRSNNLTGYDFRLSHTSDFSRRRVLRTGQGTAGWIT